MQKATASGTEDRIHLDSRRAQAIPPLCPRRTASHPGCMGAICSKERHPLSGAQDTEHGRPGHI